MNPSLKLLTINECPHCSGNDGELASCDVHTIDAGNKQAVFCNDCFCEGPPCYTGEEAIAAWNQRAPSPAVPLAIAAMEDARLVFESLATEAKEQGRDAAADVWVKHGAAMTVALAALKEAK